MSALAGWDRFQRFQGRAVNVVEERRHRTSLGSVLEIIIDATTGQLTDLGLTNQAPDLASLGLGPLRLTNSCVSTRRHHDPGCRVVGCCGLRGDGSGRGVFAQRYPQDHNASRSRPRFGGRDRLVSQQ